MRTIERPSHLDYQPADLLHLELVDDPNDRPRRYEATMTDFEVLILPSVTTIQKGGSGEWGGNEATRLGGRAHDHYWSPWYRFVMEFNRRLAQEDQRIQNAVRLWQAWMRAGMPALEPALVEVPVCSIRHGYAGTLDLLLVCLGAAMIHDHKTSNEIRSEYWAQVVAYGMALEEMLEAGTAPDLGVPYGPTLTGASIGRFGKACTEPEVVTLPRDQWGPHWAKFQAKLADY